MLTQSPVISFNCDLPNVLTWMQTKSDGRPEKKKRKKAWNIKLDTNLMQERFQMPRNVSMLLVTESTEVYLFSFASSSSSSSTAGQQA
jgi:hypothetical protein